MTNKNIPSTVKPHINNFGKNVGQVFCFSIGEIQLRVTTTYGKKPEDTEYELLFVDYKDRVDVRTFKGGRETSCFSIDHREQSYTRLAQADKFYAKHADDVRSVLPPSTRNILGEYLRK